MAQADLNVANQSGLAFRQDLNNQLLALGTLMSGATEPSSTVAYMLWVDTSTSPATIKQRNAANSGWLTVGTVAANWGLLTSSDASSTYLPLAGGTITGPLEIGSGGSLVFEGSSADANETTLAVTNPTSDRTVTLPDATGTVALLSLAQTFTAAQRGTITALTDGSTITPDFSVTNNYSVTLGGGRTLANPTNITAGQSGCIFITQDGTGSRTLAFGSYWDFPAGTAPTLTTTANAVDLLVYTVRTTTSIQAQLIANFS